MNRDHNFLKPGEALSKVLSERFRERGLLSFAEFMEVVLYDPDHGYYRQQRSPIGVEGDFFTSVSATRLFGRLLALPLRRWCGELGRGEFGEPCAVYEFGAHQGQLTRDLQAELPELEVRSVDVGDPLPERLRGCVISNELLDAMPFHRVKVVGGRWQEQYVAQAADGTLAWELGPLSSPQLEQHLEPLPRQVMEGYETEVSLQALAWLRTIAQRLEAGVVLSVDYGHDTLEYFAPRRSKGGLRCYRKHQLSTDPFAHLGEQDITCDVNFGALIELAETCGLEFVELTDQARFLLREGASVIREIAERDAGQFSRDRNAIHMLTHPQFLGGPFKVLVLRKHQAKATT